MKKAVFYHIYPLGLLGAEKTNKFNSVPKDLLVGLYPWLDHIESLGCNALYLGPVFESNSHGYDTVDYFRVDRRLGTNTALRNLVLKAEGQGIKVVLDAVFNHVGRDFWAFKDVQKFGKQSKYKDWFSNIDFTKKSPFGDTFTYDAWSGHYQLVELNLGNPEVKNHLFSAVKHWITDYSISGLRLDAADGMPFEFFEDLAAFCKELKPDFWLMGEVVQGDYNQWVNAKRLDSVTNYNYHTPFFESFNQIDFSYIANILKNQFGLKGTYKNLLLYSFVDNHDVNRAATALNKPEHLYPLFLLLFTLPGIPAIYYGSEWGFEGQKRGNSDRLLRPHVNLETLITLAKHPLLIEAIKKFISIRKNNDVLGLGSYHELLVKKEQFAFLRAYGKGSVIVIVNSSSKMETVNIPIPESIQGSYCDILNSDEIFRSGERQLRIQVPSCWGRILTPLDKS